MEWYTYDIGLSLENWVGSSLFDMLDYWMFWDCSGMEIIESCVRGKTMHVLYKDVTPINR